MQYTISPVTRRKSYGIGFLTCLYLNDTMLFDAYGQTKDQSRLNAVKLAMLLAIQESEKMVNGKIEL